MTPKRQRFVDEYLIDLNATQAAIRAGYSAKTAGSIGEENLKKPEIADAIAARQAKVAEKLEITQERIAAELAKIGFADVRQLFDDEGNLKKLSELDDKAAACISSIDLSDGDIAKVRLWDKRAALVDLGKHLGMFKERVSVENPDGGPLEIRFRRA
jgi:phage terminase small subunit